MKHCISSLVTLSLDIQVASQCTLMENLFSIYTVKRSLSLFLSWVLTGRSTVWIHSVGSWYHCPHLLYSSEAGVALLRAQQSTVGDLKRKDVFIEPRPVRCVWCLMGPVTFMWHGIKDGEADKLFNKLTCFGQGVNSDVATGLQYYGRNLPSGMMWRWVRHPPSLSANKCSAQKERVIQATAERVLYFFSSTLHAGKCLFLSQRRHIAFKLGSCRP